MTSPPERAAASILARIRDKGRKRGLRPDTMLLPYAQEGLLARIGAGRHAGRFILTGGLNMYARYGAAARPTEDIDLAARSVTNDPDGLLMVLREALAADPRDGLDLDLEGMSAEPIVEGANYAGVRVRVIARLGGARETLQLDLSFGNVITPAPVKSVFPALLRDDPHEVLGYPVETVIAEKFAAMAELGRANTRMKDFYDLHRIAWSEEITALNLRAAVDGTFSARGTNRAAAAAVLSPDFVDARLEEAWSRFLGRTRLEAPASLLEVAERLRALLVPIVRDTASGSWRPQDGAWI